MIVSYFRNRESMTNADVQTVVNTYGTSPGPSTKKEITKQPIRGPEVDKSAVEAAKKTKFHPKKPKAANYPEIYGPDLVMPPGTKPFEKTSDESADDSYFGINPDLKKAFPTDGAPQPYLTDFSKIQR